VTAFSIDLWPFRSIGVIVAHPSGVVYSTQAGGYATRHPALEGVFIPLEPGDLQARLDEHFFYGPKWEGHCYSGIDDETADFIDRLLAASPLTRAIVVDRTRLKESMEAWIHVTIASAGTDGDRAFGGFDGRSGVLIWENSD